MNCDEALELLSGHIDGSNTPEEEALLQAHLASCAACRAILSAYEELDSGLSALKVEPPADLAKGVMDTIRQEPAVPEKSRRFPIRGIAATAVAAVLLLVIGTTYLPSLDNSGEDTAIVPEAVSYTADAPSEALSPITKSIPMEEEEKTASAPDMASAEEAATPKDVQSEVPPQTDTVTTAIEPAETQSPASTFTVGTEDGMDETAVPDTLTVTPSLVTVDTPSDAVQEAFPDGQEVPQLLVELLDNPSAPAATNIVELSQLTAEATATDRIVFYECSAGTVRQIVASYETVYTFETPLQLDNATDDETCGLLVIQP